MSVSIFFSFLFFFSRSCFSFLFFSCPEQTKKRCEGQWRCALWSLVCGSVWFLIREGADGRPLLVLWGGRRKMRTVLVLVKKKARNSLKFRLAPKNAPSNGGKGGAKIETKRQRKKKKKRKLVIGGEQGCASGTSCDGREDEGGQHQQTTQQTKAKPTRRTKRRKKRLHSPLSRQTTTNLRLAAAAVV